MTFSSPSFASLPVVEKPLRPGCRPRGAQKTLLTGANFVSDTEQRHDLARLVSQTIHVQTARRLDDLKVDCDGEVISVRGSARTYHLWQLAFAAARHASRKVGGLLLDFQIQSIPVPVPE
jgi:hypothetical protein